MLNIREEITLSHWPNGSRVAVIPIINSEFFVSDHGGPCIQPHLNHLSPDIANGGWRDYGNRQGTRRLLGIFSDLKLPVSVAMNSFMIKEEPDVFQSILNKCTEQDQRVDIIGHGLTNSLSAVKHFTFEEQVEQSLNQIQQALPNGQKPTAWLTPGFAAPNNSKEILGKSKAFVVCSISNCSFSPSRYSYVSRCHQ
jgi:allantoinase